MHQKYMQYALDLAEKGRFSCSPNPMVGCVIVRDGRVIGEGSHLVAGDAHAEVNALASVEGSAEGAILYCTLEPCCHYGRTAPCTESLKRAGIAEVVIGCLDPNPLVSGNGVAALQAAGIKVTEGVLKSECKSLNKVHFHYIQKRRPYVIAKWAMSIDGKIAASSSDSKWISGESARQNVHLLRRESDAILVGSGTALQDDPRLTVRLDNETVLAEQQPLRIILDGERALPKNLKVFDAELPGKTLLASDLMSNSTYSLTDLLDKLGEKEISSLLVEGGAKTLSSFFQEELINEIQCYVAPILIGGEKSIAPFIDDISRQISAAQRFALVDTKRFDDDMLLIYRKGGGDV